MVAVSLYMNDPAGLWMMPVRVCVHIAELITCSAVPGCNGQGYTHYVGSVKNMPFGVAVTF
jgi:hypothetical protein